MKPIIGADLWAQGRAGSLERTPSWPCARTPSGYRNLTRLVTRSYPEEQSQEIPVVRRKRLCEAAKWLILHSGGLASDVGQDFVMCGSNEARRRPAKWPATFLERFGIECQGIGRLEEDADIDQAPVSAADGDILGDSCRCAQEPFTQSPPDNRATADSTLC